MTSLLLHLFIGGIAAYVAIRPREAAAILEQYADFLEARKAKRENPSAEKDSSA